MGYYILVILLPASMWLIQASEIVPKGGITILRMVLSLTFGPPVLAALLIGFAIRARMR